MNVGSVKPQKFSPLSQRGLPSIPSKNSLKKDSLSLIRVLVLRSNIGIMAVEEGINDGGCIPTLG